MAKMRYDSVSDPILGHFEWEGTPQELLVIYDGLKQRFGNTLQIGNSVPRQYDPTPKYIVAKGPMVLKAPAILKSDYSELAELMPTVEQLIAYILSKPKFEHDIVDVGMKFFHKPLKSRKYGRLYRQLKAKLENARKQIEATQRGAFERRSTPARNLQIYTFKPIISIFLGQPSQKAS